MKKQIYLSLISLSILTGCSSINSETKTINPVTKEETTTTLRAFTFINGGSAIAKASNHSTSKTAGTSLNGINQDQDAEKLGSFVESIVSGSIKGASLAIKP